MEQIDYSKYFNDELNEVLSSIDRRKYPKNYKLVRNEIEKRNFNDNHHSKTKDDFSDIAEADKYKNNHNKRYWSYVRLFAILTTMEFFLTKYGYDYSKSEFIVENSVGQVSCLEALYSLPNEVLIYFMVVTPVLIYVEITKYSDDYE